MKKTLIVLIILSLGVYFSSCDRDKLQVSPSAEITIANHTISNINSLYISDIFKVYIDFSETEESILVEANSNLHSLIEIEQHSGFLDIGLKENANISGSPILNIYLTIKSIEEINASGVVDVLLSDTLKGNNLLLELEGACNFKGAILVDNLTSDLYGPSKIDISGSSNYFEITGEGASEMAGFDFITNKLNANLNGGCKISLTVEESLDINAEGASKVYYNGNGVIKKLNLKDASEVLKLD